MEKMTEKEILDDIASFFPDGGWQELIRIYDKYIADKYPFCEESCVEFAQTGYFAHGIDEHVNDLEKYTGEDYSAENIEPKEIKEKYHQFIGKKIFEMAALDRYLDNLVLDNFNIKTETLDYYVNYRNGLGKPMDFKTELSNLVGKYEVSIDQLKAAIRSPEVKKSLSEEIAR